MYVNIINSYRDVVAVADAELLGKTFEEGEKQLEIKESFYKGENGRQMTREEVHDIILNWSKEDATFNLVGEKTISLALEMNLISKEGIGKIKDIPYAMVLL